MMRKFRPRKQWDNKGQPSAVELRASHERQMAAFEGRPVRITAPHLSREARRRGRRIAQGKITAANGLLEVRGGDTKDKS